MVTTSNKLKFDAVKMSGCPVLFRSSLRGYISCLIFCRNMKRYDQYRILPTCNYYLEVSGCPNRCPRNFNMTVVR